MAKKLNEKEPEDFTQRPVEKVKENVITSNPVSGWNPVTVRESLSSLVEVVKEIVQNQVHPTHDGEWLIKQVSKLDKIQQELPFIPF